MSTIEIVRNVVNESKKDLLKKANVVAVGVGLKTVAGVATSEVCVVVSVKQKLPIEKLPAKDVIPQTVGDGTKTDVTETGEFVALKERSDWWRPYPAGVSMGHKDITAGTLGAFVKRGDDILLLSNNHVFANSNEAAIGDAIFQPGRIDGGREEDTVASLLDYVPISFSGDTVPICPIAGSIEKVLNKIGQLLGSSHKFSLSKEAEPGDPNLVDCAIATPIKFEDMELMILEIGYVKGVSEPTLGTPIQKSGRTTGYTQGVVIQLHVTAQVNYGGPIALFEDQIMSGPMSDGGDSGSLVLDMDNNAVGLLFAGSDNTTLSNPITHVLSKLSIEFTTERDAKQHIVDVETEEESETEVDVEPKVYTPMHPWYPLPNIKFRR